MASQSLLERSAAAAIRCLLPGPVKSEERSGLHLIVSIVERERGPVGESKWLLKPNSSGAKVVPRRVKFVKLDSAIDYEEFDVENTTNVSLSKSMGMLWRVASTKR